MKGSYIIHGGEPGAKRLEIISNATWPFSEDFLQVAGLKNSLRILEVGCGGGAITRRLIEKLPPQAQLVCIDFDKKAIDIAKSKVSAGPIRVEFHDLDIERSDLTAIGGDFDFIYLRFVLSHLRNPSQAIEKVRNLLRPKGVLAAEDVDFSGHFSYPRSESFDRYVALYTQVARAKGANADLGPQLPELFGQHGLRQVKFRVAAPAFRDGDGKQAAILTLASIKDTLLSEGIIQAAEYEKLEADLAQLTRQDGSILGLPRIFQCWGSS